MNYPYANSPNKIPKFINDVKGIGKPAKFVTKTLESIGYKSGNDTRLIAVIKFIGLIDNSNVPTNLWTEFRGSPGKALAKGIKAGYADLYSHYPDAHNRDDEALRNFFSANTDLGAAAVGKVTNTFKALCSVAVFGDLGNAGEQPEEPEEAPGPAHKDAGTKAKRRHGRTADGLVVNINIQLQLPADADGDTYEKFFAAMKKYLLEAG